MDYEQDETDQDIEIVDIRNLKRPSKQPAASHEAPKGRDHSDAKEEKPGKRRRKPIFKVRKAQLKHQVPAGDVGIEGKTTLSQNEPGNVHVTSSNTDSPHLSTNNDEQKRHKVHKKCRKEYQEFGNSVNGYRFVRDKGAEQDSGLPDIKFDDNDLYRHSVFPSEAYLMSYEKLEIPKPCVDKYSVESYRSEAKSAQEQSYKEYLAKWKLVEVIKDEAQIVWPHLANDYKQIDPESLKLFLGEDDKKVWKTERIRWHPDNLKKKLDKSVQSERLVREITKVFQMINDGWERYSG